MASIPDFGESVLRVAQEFDPVVHRDPIAYDRIRGGEVVAAVGGEYVARWTGVPEVIAGIALADAKEGERVPVASRLTLRSHGKEIEPASTHFDRLVVEDAQS